MRCYRQHPIVLSRPLLRACATSTGIGVAMLVAQQPLLLALLLLPLGYLSWFIARWWLFRLHIEQRPNGRTAVIRSLSGLRMFEEALSLDAFTSYRLEQGVIGWFFNVGTLEVETFDATVRIPVLGPYRRLSRELDHGEALVSGLR